MTIPLLLSIGIGTICIVGLSMEIGVNQRVVSTGASPELKAKAWRMARIGYALLVVLTVVLFLNVALLLLWTLSQ